MGESRFLVQPNEDGQRLDKVVTARLSGLGRKGARLLFEQGRVRVRGRVATKGDVAQSGDEVVVALEEATAGAAVAEPAAPLSIAYETDRIVVVEKPAGQPTAPLRPGETGTLVNSLVARYPEMQAFGHAAREPGLVHRLDTDTSGLVLAARTEAAFVSLSAALKAGAIDKAYWLICEGGDLADSGTIAIPLAHHPKDRRRMYPCVHPRDVHRYDPRPASTAYRVVERAARWALVEVEAKSAIRHQIRAHLAAIEHPLANDLLYGGAPVPGLTGHALHASRIRFGGDATVAGFDVRSPVPESWRLLFGVSGRGGAVA